MKRKDDEVQHEVTLTRDFEMMKYEVTQVLYVMGEGENPLEPVEQVSWFDCVVLRTN